MSYKLLNVYNFIVHYMTHRISLPRSPLKKQVPVHVQTELWNAAVMTFCHWLLFGGNKRSTGSTEKRKGKSIPQCQCSVQTLCADLSTFLEVWKSLLTFLVSIYDQTTWFFVKNVFSFRALYICVKVGNFYFVGNILIFVIELFQKNVREDRLPLCITCCYFLDCLC